MAGVPTKPPRFTTRDYGAYARRAMGRDLHTKDVAYRMGENREFKDDAGIGGIYLGATGAPRLLEDGSTRLDEDDGARLCE
jgi:hypothetical protein